MVTMAAPSDFSRNGIAALAPVNICMTSMSKPFLNSSGVVLAARALALATKMSSPPSALAPSAIQASSAFGSATSTARAKTLAPLASKARAVSATCFALREQMATAQPSATKRSAMARPMPRVDPVTKTLRPFSCRSMAAVPYCLVDVVSAAADMDRRLAIPPRHGAFQFGAELDQQMVLARPRAQLDADGQAVRVHPQGQRHGRLAGHVVEHHELLKGFLPGDEFLGRQVDVHVEKAELGRRLGRRRRQPDIVFGEEGAGGAPRLVHEGEGVEEAVVGHASGVFVEP